MTIQDIEMANIPLCQAVYFVLIWCCFYYIFFLVEIRWMWAATWHREHVNLYALNPVMEGYKVRKYTYLSVFSSTIKFPTFCCFACQGNNNLDWHKPTREIGAYYVECQYKNVDTVLFKFNLVQGSCLHFYIFHIPNWGVIIIHHGSSQHAREYNIFSCTITSCRTAFRNIRNGIGVKLCMRVSWRFITFMYARNSQPSLYFYQWLQENIL